MVFVIWGMSLAVGCGPAQDETLSALSLSADPAEVTASPVFFGQTVERTVEAQAGGAAMPLSGARLEDASGPATAAVTVVDGAAALRITGGDSVGLFTVRLVLEVGTSAVEVPVTATVQPLPACDDDNPCTVDRFDGSGCVHDALPDGSSCDDDNVCTTDDVCVSGQCLGAMLPCDDGVACTIDRCDPAVGCVAEANHGACNDGDACTDDVCDPTAGCQVTPKEEGALCANDLACGDIGFCIGGQCELSPVPDGFPCEDGNVCTSGDTCEQGVCVAGGGGDPASYRALTQGSYAANLCGGAMLYPDPDQLCQGDLVLDPAQVLAARPTADGYEAIWRTPYVTPEGNACDPLNAYLPVPPPGVPVPPPPPDVIDYCGAAVFFSPDDGTPARQLTTVYGPVAAAFKVFTEQPFDPAPAAGRNNNRGVADEAPPGDVPPALTQADFVIAQTRADLTEVRVEAYHSANTFPVGWGTFTPNIATDIGPAGEIDVVFQDGRLVFTTLEAMYCLYGVDDDGWCQPRVALFQTGYLEGGFLDAYNEYALYEASAGCVISGQRLYQADLQLRVDPVGETQVLARRADACSLLDPGFAAPARVEVIRTGSAPWRLYLSGMRDAALHDGGLLVHADEICDDGCTGCDELPACMAGPMVHIDDAGWSPVPAPPGPGPVVSVPDVAGHAVFTLDAVHLGLDDGYTQFPVSGGAWAWSSTQRPVAAGAAAASVMGPSPLFDGLEAVDGDFAGGLSQVAVQPFACLELQP